MAERLKRLTSGMALMLGLVIAGLYYAFMYDSGEALETSIKNSRAEYESTTKDLERLEKAISDAERFKLTVASLGAEMDRILLAIPAKLTSLDLMKTMSTEAKAVGVDINSVSSTGSVVPNKDPADQFYEGIPIDIALSGTYNQIMLFLSNLTRLDKIIVAKKLNLVSSLGSVSVNNVPTIGLTASFLAFRYVSENKEAANAK